MLVKGFYHSPLGKITILGDDQAILGVWFDRQKHFGANYDLNDVPEQDTPVVEQAKNWLDEYFSGRRPAISQLSLAPDVTDFRQQVLNVLQTIPYGKTMTYKEIAEEISHKHDGKFVSPRAVGGAVGHNPISIIIPCHRVVGSDGNLTGYAGGIDRKIQLLNSEGVSCDGKKQTLKA